MELTEKQIEEALEWEATVTRERRELIERMDEQGNRVNLKAREPQGPEILAAAYRAEHERAERLAKALADAATALASISFARLRYSVLVDYADIRAFAANRARIATAALDGAPKGEPK